MNNMVVVVYVNVSMSIEVSANAVMMNANNAFNIVNNVTFCTGYRFFVTKRIARNVVNNCRSDNWSNRLDGFNVLNDCIGEQFLTISHAFQIKTDYFRPVSFKIQGVGFFVPRIQSANGSAADVDNFKTVPRDGACRRSYPQFNLKAGTVS